MFRGLGQKEKSRLAAASGASSVLLLGFFFRQGDVQLENFAA